MALGSDRTRLVARALRLAALPAVLGSAAGYCGAIGMAVWMRSLLYGLAGASAAPMTVAAVSAMAVAVLCAALPSALRAARTEPESVLRGE